MRIVESANIKFLKNDKSSESENLEDLILVRYKLILLYHFLFKKFYYSLNYITS